MSFGQSLPSSSSVLLIVHAVALVAGGTHPICSMTAHSGAALPLGWDVLDKDKNRVS